MPALKPTGFAGRIAWAGLVADRAAGLASRAVDRLDLDFAGPRGDAHAGLTRASCARVTAQHPKGTEIRNVRQLSVMSAEEMTVIAERLGLARLDPAWIGATLVLEGLPDLSLLPPGARLQGPDGTTLVVDMMNQPCHLPDPVIRAEAGTDPAMLFRQAARGRRGVTAWVERPGVLNLGDVLRLHVPDQPAWPHLAAARADRDPAA